MTSLSWALLVTLASALALAVWQRRRAQALFAEARQRMLAQSEQLQELSARHTQTAAFLDAVATVSAPATLLVDGAKTVLWLNQEARAWCTPDVTPPVRLSQAVRSYEVLELVDEAMEDQSPHDRQFVRDSRTYHANVVQVASEPLLIAITVKDVTELQRIGRVRRDFVANISHDLRTPITAIQVMVETLQGPVGDNRKRREALLQAIADQTGSIQQLSQELLDLSLIESGRMPLRMVSTPVTELVEPVIQQMSAQAQHKHITLAASYPERLQALADPDQVRRVLTNLVHNALKFTPEGGDVLIQAEADGEDVRLSVADTGIGIAADDLSRVFERFFKADRTRSEGGTGLGLAIARHIVEGHGGRIWVESTQGQGATFFFTLPLA